MQNMVITGVSKQGLTYPNCFAVLSYACMKEFINMNSICLLEVERNGIKQNNLKNQHDYRKQVINFWDGHFCENGQCG